MTTKSGGWLRRCFGGTSFSPRGLFVDAVLVALVFLLCNLAGLKEYTSVICGTSPTGSMASPYVVAFGVLYLAAHFAFVLLTPILLIASAVFTVLNLAVPGKQKT